MSEMSILFFFEFKEEFRPFFPSFMDGFGFDVPVDRSLVPFEFRIFMKSNITS